MILQYTEDKYQKKFKTQESISENSPRFSVNELEINKNGKKFMKFNYQFEFAQGNYSQLDIQSYHKQLSQKNQIKIKQVLQSIRSIRKQIKIITALELQSINESNSLKSSIHTLQDHQNLQIKPENQIKNLQESRNQNLEELVSVKEEEINKLKNNLIQIQNALYLKEEENIKNLMQIKNEYTQIITTLKSQIEKKNEESDYQYHYINILKNEINKLQNQEDKLINNQKELIQQELNQEGENTVQDMKLNKIQNIPFDIIQQKQDNTSREDRSKRQNLDTSRSVQNSLNLKKNQSFALQQQVNGLLRALDDLRNQLQSKQDILSNQYLSLQKLNSQNRNLVEKNEMLTREIQNLRIKQNEQNNTLSVIKQELNFHKNLIAKNVNILENDNGISYEDILKSQMQQNEQLKQNLNKFRLENQSLSIALNNMRLDFQNLSKQYEIQKLKYMSQKNNSKINFQIQIQNYKNQLLIQRRTIDGYLQKLKALKQQILHKDNFIKNQIINKKFIDKTSVQEFFKLYEFEFDVENLKSKLHTEYKKIIQFEQQNALLKLQLNKIRLTETSINMEN